MKYLIDTNIFLRFLVREDEKDYRECSQLFADIGNSRIEATTAGIVLSEISWVLGSYYKQKPAVVAEKLASILKFKGLSISDNYDWLKAINIYGKKKVKFIDTVLATIPQMADKEWTIVSYDEDFKKLPVLWKKPGQMSKA